MYLKVALGDEFAVSDRLGVKHGQREDKVHDESHRQDGDEVPHVIPGECAKGTGHIVTTYGNVLSVFDWIALHGTGKKLLDMLSATMRHTLVGVFW